MLATILEQIVKWSYSLQILSSAGVILHCVSKKRLNFKTV